MWAGMEQVAHTLAYDGRIVNGFRLQADRVAVNSMCPGWVRTEMGGPNAERSVEEGADTAVWLADEAPHQRTN